MKFMTSDEQMLRKALVTGSYWPTTFEPGERAGEEARAAVLRPAPAGRDRRRDVSAREVRDAAGVHRRVDQPVAGVRPGRHLHRGLPGRAVGRGAAAAMSGPRGHGRRRCARPRAETRGGTRVAPRPAPSPAAGSSARRPGMGRGIAISLLPAVLLFGAFFLVPLGVVVVTSIADWGPLGFAFTGLENYRLLFADGAFWAALRNTAMFAAAAVFIQVPVGVAVAIILSRQDPRLAAAAHDLLPAQHRLRRGARARLRHLLQPALRAAQPGARRGRPRRRRATGCSTSTPRSPRSPRRGCSPPGS